MGLFRRQFLRLVRAALVLPAVGGLGPESFAADVADERSPLLSMAEIRAGEFDHADIVQRRFDLYKSLGCGGVRTSMGWRTLEKRDGVWNAQNRALQNYYGLVKQNGFRLKCQMGAVSAVPGWFHEKYPGSRLINQRGDTLEGYLSPWFPAAEALLAEKIERVFAGAREVGAFDNLDYLIVDLGPGGGEPTYPAAWHMGRGYTPQNSLFWYFDPHAQKDFGVKMEHKYAGDLAKANAAWKTGFKSWAEVTPPAPNTIRGPIWFDLLGWYFEAKRRMMAQQVANVVRLLKTNPPPQPIRPMLLMPGDHATKDDWELTAKNGIGTYLVKIGAEVDFVVDLAAKNNCWLQYG